MSTLGPPATARAKSRLRRLVADRDHVEDLPVDQFDAIFWREDAGLGHLVIGLDVQAVAGRDLLALQNFTHGSPLGEPTYAWVVSNVNRNHCGPILVRIEALLRLS